MCKNNIFLPYGKEKSGKADSLTALPQKRMPYADNR